jgi:hypothetical protein
LQLAILVLLSTAARRVGRQREVSLQPFQVSRWCAPGFAAGAVEHHLRSLLT